MRKITILSMTLALGMMVCMVYAQEREWGARPGSPRRSVTSAPDPTVGALTFNYNFNGVQYQEGGEWKTWAIELILTDYSFSLVPRGTGQVTCNITADVYANNVLLTTVSMNNVVNLHQTGLRGARYDFNFVPTMELRNVRISNAQVMGGAAANSAGNANSSSSLWGNNSSSGGSNSSSGSSLWGNNSSSTAQSSQTAQNTASSSGSTASTSSASRTSASSSSSSSTASRTTQSSSSSGRVDNQRQIEIQNARTQQAMSNLNQATQNFAGAVSHVFGPREVERDEYGRTPKEAREAAAAEQEAIWAAERRSRDTPGRDYSQEVRYYESRVAEGDVEALFTLGDLYWENGGRIEDGWRLPNYAKARDWWEKYVANLGKNSVDVMVLLGKVYDGWRCEFKNEAKALEWYTKAANKGDVEAMYLIAELCRINASKYDNKKDNAFGQYNKYIKDKTAEAIKWYNKAAENGHVDAQIRLGINYITGYMYGVKVKKDKNEAAKWFRKAADQGSSAAKEWMASNKIRY